MLLIDTPGIMLPKLTASTYAYRVALAGLVQETQVQLPELFAFTLYVLAQPPNRSQLKAVLAQRIPEEDFTASHGGKPGAGNQAAIRIAYASKRFAKCILQAIDEVVAAHGPRNASGYEAGDALATTADIWQQHAACSEPESEEQAPFRSEQAAQSLSGCDAVGSVQMTNQQDTSRRRPRLAAEYLAMMNSSSDQSDSANQALSLEPVSLSPLQQDKTGTEKLSAGRGDSTQGIWRSDVNRQQSVAGWMPFDSGMWSLCGQILLYKLMKPNNASRGWEPRPAQANDAMERVVRLVRDGHLGRLVFEKPETKPGKKRRAFPRSSVGPRVVRGRSGIATGG
jgi:hypothetical protein